MGGLTRGRVSSDWEFCHKSSAYATAVGPALRVIQAQGQFRSNRLVKIWCKWLRKNKDISESVNSIDSGAIFPSRSGHELSRNVGGMSVYAL